MGTRALMIITSREGRTIGEYVSMDGYPSGTGIEVLEFLKNDISETGLNDSVNNVLETEDWDSVYYLHPEGAEFLKKLQNTEKMVIYNDLLFAADSLFCEWAYEIDLKNRKFIVYRGFNETPLDESERFYYLQQDEILDDLNDYTQAAAGVGPYYPVREIVAYSFDNLPSHKIFLNELSRKK